MNNKIGLRMIILTLLITPEISLVAYAQMRQCPNGPMLPIGVACPSSITEQKTVIEQKTVTTEQTTAPSGGGNLPTTNPATTKSPSTGKTGGSQIISLPNPLGSVKTIPELIGRIVDWLIFIASIAILPFMIVWGAYQLLTAGGNPDAVTSARHTITWAVAGYALLLISKGIEFIIRDILTRGV